jgi:hypothetical protein
MADSGDDAFVSEASYFCILSLDSRTTLPNIRLFGPTTISDDLLGLICTMRACYQWSMLALCLLLHVAVTGSRIRDFGGRGRPKYCHGMPHVRVSRASEMNHATVGSGPGRSAVSLDEAEGSAIHLHNHQAAVRDIIATV